MMGIEGAEPGFDKGLRQRLEPLCGAVPGEFVGGVGYRRAEFLFEAAAHHRVQAIGGDDQVVTGQLVDRMRSACRNAV